MVDNIYSNKLSFDELIINYLNKKANTKFNVRDFNWELLGSQLDSDKCEDSNYVSYKLTHRCQKLFPGEHIVKIYNQPNDELSIKIQPPVLISENPITEDSCCFPYTESYQTYSKNKIVQIEQAVGLLNKKDRNVPNLFSSNQSEIIVNDINIGKSLIDIEDTIFIGLVPPLKSERYITFLYITKCMTRTISEPITGDIESNDYFYINDNVTFKKRLINYFKQNWGEDWDGSIDGWNFDGCYHIATINDNKSSTKDCYHIMHFPPNGIRACGILIIVDRVSTSSDINFPVYLTNDCSNTSNTNLSDMIDIIFNYLTKYIIPNNLLNDFDYKELLSKPVYNLYKENMVNIMIGYCLKYLTDRLNNINNTLGAYYDTISGIWYMTKINNPELNRFNFTQLVFKTEGFDISRFLPKNLSVSRLDKEGKVIDIRTAIFNKTNIMLPSEREGLLVKYLELDNNGNISPSYLFTVTHGLAATIFKKGSTLLVPIDSNQ